MARGQYPQTSGPFGAVAQELLELADRGGTTTRGRHGLTGQYTPNIGIGKNQAALGEGDDSPSAATAHTLRLRHRIGRTHRCHGHPDAQHLHMRVGSSVAVSSGLHLSGTTACSVHGSGVASPPPLLDQPASAHGKVTWGCALGDMRMAASIKQEPGERTMTLTRQALAGIAATTMMLTATAYAQ